MHLLARSRLSRYIHITRLLEKARGAAREIKARGICMCRRRSCIPRERSGILRRATSWNIASRGNVISRRDMAFWLSWLVIFFLPRVDFFLLPFSRSVLDSLGVEKLVLRCYYHLCMDDFYRVHLCLSVGRYFSRWRVNYGNSSNAGGGGLN